MLTDKLLRDRLSEIRAQRLAGEISPARAAALREGAFAARKEAREEYQFRGQQAPKLSRVWTGQTAAAIDPGKELFFALLRVLVDILKSPVRDAETGMPKIRQLPSVSKADTEKRGPAKGWRGGARLPVDHHVLFALLPKRPPADVKVPALATPVEIALAFGVHKTKREVFNSARSANPLAEASKRADALAASGWLVAILRTPEVDKVDTLEERANLADRLREKAIAADIRKRIDKGGNCPKTGWGPNMQTFTWHDGMIVRPEERALFGLHDSAAGHRSKLRKECEELRDYHQLHQQLAGRDSEAEIDLPMPEPEGLVEYTVKLSGPLQVGEESDGTPVWVHEVTIKQDPCTDDKDADGSAIPGTGAATRAREIALEHSVGPQGINAPKSVHWICPATGEPRSVTRTESLLGLEPERGFEDLESEDPLDALEAMHQRMAQGEIIPRKRHATHWTRKTNVSGPWMRVSQDRDTWGTYQRSQGL